MKEGINNKAYCINKKVPMEKKNGFPIAVFENMLA